VSLGSLRGRLLVATPPLTDPNFDRTVVLLLEHNDDGAVGVVVNRPSGTTLADALPDWHPHAAPPAVAFIGGPVATDALIGVARLDGAGPGGELFTPLFLNLGTVDLGGDPLELPGLVSVRVFAGYAGWAPGQLESELEAGAWVSLEAETSDAFVGDPAGLWRAVLARQGGELAVLARLYPDDPSLN